MKIAKKSLVLFLVLLPSLGFSQCYLYSCDTPGEAAAKAATMVNQNSVCSPHVAHDPKIHVFMPGSYNLIGYTPGPPGEPYVPVCGSDFAGTGAVYYPGTPPPGRESDPCYADDNPCCGSKDPCCGNPNCSETCPGENNTAK